MSIIKVLVPIFILAFVIIGISSAFPQLTQFVKGKVSFIQKENDVIISDNNLGLDSEDSGEVVGVFAENPQLTPMPTPIGKKSTTNPIPTLPAPTTAADNPNSNSPSGNESKNNPSNQQSNTNSGPAVQNTGILTPTSIPTPPIATTVPPTPAPTPDNTPFEASWETGSNPLATVTANKPLKRCLWKQWGVKEKAEGEGTASGNSCTILSAAWGIVESHKLWVKAEAVSGETKEFGDVPPSQ